MNVLIVPESSKLQPVILELPLSATSNTFELPGHEVTKTGESRFLDVTGIPSTWVRVWALDTHGSEIAPPHNKHAD
ncbi:MAG: hypothetical protein DRJ50_12595 [Actinobacteria bacterium]|nr:MAG: hypothetical protein DRJ50_12595 [Actinomycetota bacterium]